MNVHRKVAGLLREILSRPAEEFGGDFALAAENGVTPLDVARLAIACERGFGLALYDEKIARWRRVGDVVAHIEGLLDDGETARADLDDDDRTAWFYP